jgi:hypothetical protein
MSKPHVRKRVICAAAAVVLTALSSTVFVSAEPTNLDRQATPLRTAAVTVDSTVIESVVVVAAG